jgi:hypothetical protein
MHWIWDTPFRHAILAAMLSLLAEPFRYTRSLLQLLLAAAVIAYVPSPAASFRRGSRSPVARTIDAGIGIGNVFHS